MTHGRVILRHVSRCALTVRYDVSNVAQIAKCLSKNVLNLKCIAVRESSQMDNLIIHHVPVSVFLRFPLVCC